MFKIQVFRNVTPRRLVDSHPSFEESYCPRLHREEVKEESTVKDLSL